MTSPDSAEKSLQTVAAEIIAAEEEDEHEISEQRASSLLDRLASGEDDANGGVGAGDSSAAVLEVSSGTESLQHELNMAQVNGDGTAAGAALPAALESLTEPRPSPASTGSGDTGMSAAVAASQSTDARRQSASRPTMGGGAPASAASQSTQVQQQQRPSSQQQQKHEQAMAVPESPGGDGLVVHNPSEPESTVGQPLVASVTEKLLNLKQWSVKQYKMTRQHIAEQTSSTATRTTDPKLSDRLRKLMAQRDKYNALLRLALRLCGQVRDIKATQRELANVLGAFTARSDELGTELEANTRTQRQLARNGDILYEALSCFCSNLTLLLTKTMEDTFTQLRAYQTARVEYDAYRADETSARAAAEAYPESVGRRARYERKQTEVAERKARFETLRKDLTVRVHFLEQNQLRVMTRQLTLFHNATCAYFSGDADQLEKCIRQFHLKVPQNLGTEPGAAASAAAQKEEEVVSLEPLPFPTPTALGTPSEALSTLLMQQLTTTDGQAGASPSPPNDTADDES